MLTPAIVRARVAFVSTWNNEQNGLRSRSKFATIVDNGNIIRQYLVGTNIAGDGRCFYRKGHKKAIKLSGRLNAILTGKKYAGKDKESMRQKRMARGKKELQI